MSPISRAGPLPLPRIDMPRETRSRSRRVRQRHRRAAVATELANRAIEATNTLFNSFSTSSTKARNHTTAAASRAVAHIYECAAHYVSRLAPDYAKSDDTDTSTTAADARLATDYATVSSSSPLDADRVALPESAKFINLLDFLPEELARDYATERPELFRPVEERKRAPRAVSIKSPEDWVRICRRLHDLTMTVYRTKDEVKVINGVFATDKSDNMQRLVTDGRPTNARWAVPRKVQLPTPDLLARMRSDPDRELFVAKVDLDNFFHRIKTPEWMWAYFALPPVRAGDVGQGDSFGPDAMIYPCLTTLPMGWSHSAFLAQAVHEFILDTKTSLRREDRITRAADIRLDRQRHHVYLDDLNFLDHDAKRCRRLQEEYIRVCDEIGLPVKMSKVVEPSSDGVETVGLEIHGRHLTCGLSPSKLHRLSTRTGALLERGECTGRELQSIVGLWGWAFLARRPAFSVFGAVYRFIEKAGTSKFIIWNSVARELRVAVGLAPLLFASLAAPWLPEVFASDASEEGMGVTSAELSTPAMDDLARRPPPHVACAQCDSIGAVSMSCHRCRTTHYCSENCRDNHQNVHKLTCGRAKATTGRPPLRAGQPRPRALDPELAGLTWRTIISARWKWAEHINHLEARAVSVELRRIISSPTSIGTRVLSMCDSIVVLYGLRKGRSSAHGLLRVLREIGALLLATGIHLYVNWIPTEFNPADEPSRHFKFDSTLGFPGEGPGGTSVFLHEAAHTRGTVSRYRAQVRAFLEWMFRNREDPRSVSEMDAVLSEYVHHLYIERGGKGRSSAENTLYGVELFLPRTKGKLRLTRLSLAGWKKLVPPKPFPPLTWDLAVMVAVRLVTEGHFLMGVATLVAFDAYLRVGEFTNIYSKDIAEPGDHRMGAGFNRTAIRIRHAKTGKNQWAEVREPAVQELLHEVLELTAPGDRIFPFSPRTYRKHFRAACDALGISRKYVPHSLRHGGATRDHLRGVHLEEILRRGRWASTKSARHYIQAGRALLLATRVPKHTARLAGVLASDVQLAFSLAQQH